MTTTGTTMHVDRELTQRLMRSFAPPVALPEQLRNELVSTYSARLYGAPGRVSLTRSESSGLLSSVLPLVPLCAALCSAAFQSTRCCATSPASSLGPSAGLLTTHIPSCRCGTSSSTRMPFWCINPRVLSTNLTLRAGRMTAVRVRQNRSEHVPN